MVLQKPAVVLIALIGTSWILDGNSVLVASAPQSTHTVEQLWLPAGSYPAKLNNAPLPSEEANPQPTGPYRGPIPQPAGSNGGAIPQPTGPNGGANQQPTGPNGSYMPQQGLQRPYMPQQGPYGPYMRQPQPYGPYMPQPGAYGPYMPQTYMMPPPPMSYNRQNRSQKKSNPNQNAVKADHVFSFLNGQAFNNMDFEFGV